METWWFTPPCESGQRSRSGSQAKRTAREVRFLLSAPLQSIMELIFRIILTVVLTGVWLIGLRWVWTNQLDPRATVSRLSERALAPPDWVATRDPNKIYQGNAAVGDVTGDVKNEKNQIRFAQLANTAGFDASKPFEYQRFTLRIVRVGMMAGMKVEMTEAGSQTLTGVFEDVLCDIVN